MLKKMMITSIILMIMSSISIAQDSMGDWSAYLFDNINYDLIRVDADGNTNVFSLGLAENELLSLNELTVSHNGTLVAYCKTVFASASDCKSVIEFVKGSVIKKN